ncbi:bifunctional (p)ppGpp synthetase/guanosine-3',5'-bis(diphosphate) 3'-pyrophosphohydrolase [bacterium SCSIO 12696]|nr:bifunctional (p)ppGpp synthetase/guanosine-3',5'-bis(diphosphate) 3'-pyrophosphohydrolase [bacterium SCSIO 12696]
MLDKARAYAIKNHGDQQYGDKPYIYHLESVVSILQPYGERAQVIGYLHDVVEDTPATFEEIARAFDADIAKAVAILTDQVGANRKERKRKTYQIMSRVTGDLEIALLVKTADRLANIQAAVDGGRKDKFAMYAKEHDQFREAVYRPGLCDDLWLKISGLMPS